MFAGIYRHIHGGGGAQDNSARLLQIPAGQVELFRHYNSHAESCRTGPFKRQRTHYSTIFPTCKLTAFVVIPS